MPNRKMRIHKSVEPVVDPELRRQWTLDHPHCQCCGIHADQAAFRRYPPGLQVHHIIGGGRRYDYKWNFLTLCALCHGHLHSGGYKADDGEKLPDLTLAHMIWVKQDTAPVKGFRKRDLSKLYGRKVPVPEQLPPAFMRMRSQYGFTGGKL